MRVLRKGMSGEDVELWQQFLRGQGYDIIVDGDFGTYTEITTGKYQKTNNLNSDGVVGPKTLATALLAGFVANLVDDDPDKTGPNWPPPPDFKPLSPTERINLFGQFKYIPAPANGNPEGIRITDGWDKTNIVNIVVPQLKDVQYAPKNCSIAWHTKGVDQLLKLFKDWEEAGLLDRVLTWGGSWNPRFVRGSRASLSNHAWSTAFDINVPWNGLGHEPARMGKKGSVRELVELANDNGFFWGGHYPNRKDGMHFEIAKLS